jgi:hypothetical protein
MAAILTLALRPTLTLTLTGILGHSHSGLLPPYPYPYKVDVDAGFEDIDENSGDEEGTDYGGTDDDSS